MGEYRLLRRLGAGGMGQVFLGRTAGGRTVAVKMVHSSFAADREFRVRFRQEVAAARRVGGRWTAPVLDADTESDHPWVATGYIAGPSLGSAVRMYGPLPAAAVRSLGVGLAEALDVVHGLGLVHRDVKPSNVLLALDGPRLIDFGISRALDAATALTRSGFMVGSPGYLSPEQAEGLTVGPASDVFSLGTVLAYAATGVPPFGAGVSTPVLLYRVLHEEPDLGGLDTLDPGLRELVAACLAKDPEQRPTPAALRARLVAEDGAAADRLTARDWLPAPVAGELARLAVDLLDLDPDADPSQAATPAQVEAVEEPSGYSLRTPTVSGMTVAPPPPDHPPTGAATAASAPLPAETRAAADGTVPRSRVLPVVAAVVAVVLAAGAAVYFAGIPGTHKAGGGKQAGGARSVAATGPSTEASSPTSAAASPATDPSAKPDAGTIPAGFLGGWHGSLTNRQSGIAADLEITVAQGRKGDPVGTIHNNTGPGTRYCDSVADLIGVGTDRLVLKTRTMSALTGCVADPHEQVYTLNADGSLHLTVGAFAGDLTRS
ncbi:serine/threonine-protein kinase [Kitasatospora camelliae]|uniref:Serine/threonine-protein kinase n=1 Tax=Kitasatospora camelliae TaxID=3156397 RepID=A0AAU8K7S7_9ACTN